MSTTTKPSHTEEEYFARIEAEKKKQLAADYARTLDLQEKKKLKDLHWMRCPKCGLELHAVPFKGITIDKCFSCNGIFLDDGELEKIAGKEEGFLTSVLSLFKT